MIVDTLFILLVGMLLFVIFMLGVTVGKGTR